MPWHFPRTFLLWSQTIEQPHPISRHVPNWVLAFIKRSVYLDKVMICFHCSKLCNFWMTSFPLFHLSIIPSFHFQTFVEFIFIKRKKKKKLYFLSETNKEMPCVSFDIGSSHFWVLLLPCPYMKGLWVLGKRVWNPLGASSGFIFLPR